MVSHSSLRDSPHVSQASRAYILLNNVWFDFVGKFVFNLIEKTEQDTDFRPAQYDWNTKDEP